MNIWWVSRNVLKLLPRQPSVVHLSSVRHLPTVSDSFKKSDAPYYEEEEIQDPSVITVPLRLQRRLSKKLARETTKGALKQRIIDISRQGSKKNVVISCKNQSLNHYKGQSYDPKKELPLITKGWKHRKSVGDHFTIHSVGEDESFLELEGRETFEDLGLSGKISEALKDQDITRPTLIQATAIPEILKGRNNLIAAETGCGKTLAYLLPVLHQILTSRTPRLRKGPNQPTALILVPTRELADQVHSVATGLGQTLRIRSRLLQGGNIHSKLNNPSTKEVDVLISTVSVVSTLSAMELYDMSRVNHIVLDEADTLLDDSFNKEVIRFLGRFKFEGSAEDRVVQATLVSATMPRSVEEILGSVVPMDSLRRVTTPGLHRVAKSVPQKFRRVRKMDKPGVMLEMVNETIEKKVPMMIFGNRGSTCHWLGKHLKASGADCATLHGKMVPSERRELLDQYHNGDVDVLICTDVASRGINTIRTKHVVNYEFPSYLADYIHRCGRVGRVGSEAGGLITNLISGANEVEIVQQIEASVRRDETLQRVNANIKRLLNNRYGMFQSIEPVDEDEENSTTNNNNRRRK